MELEDWHRWWKSRGAPELRRLLMTYWDPIGVKDAPEAADEYDSYLGPLANKLRNGADVDAVAEYLSGVQTDGMDLPVQPSQLLPVAHRVIDWYSAGRQG